MAWAAHRAPTTAGECKVLALRCMRCGEKSFVCVGLLFPLGFFVLCSLDASFSDTTMRLLPMLMQVQELLLPGVQHPAPVSQPGHGAADTHA